MCSHKDSVPSLVPKYKVETLYSGTGTVPEFWLGYQEKRCVHIGARRRIEPGHSARAPSVNTALDIQDPLFPLPIAISFLTNYVREFGDVVRSLSPAHDLFAI